MPDLYAQMVKDAARYRMLRELGAAPCDWPGLDKGHVLRFTNLDEHVDAVMQRRGKATAGVKEEGKC